MKDIAEICSVSVATVSKIVNGKDMDIGEETRRRVNKVIVEKGYYINTLAQSMKTKNTKTLGLIIPDVKNAYYTDISRGAEDMAQKLGYSLFLCNTDDQIDKEINYITKLMEKQVDGIIIIASLQRDKEKEEALHIKVPFAVLNNSTSYRNSSVCVDVDKYSGMYQGVKHLIELGHRNIMYMSSWTDLSFNEDRIAGYRDALEESGILYRESLITGGVFKMEGISAHLNDHGIQEGITAIACENDLMAVGVMNWANENGVRVPEDLSVMGFDDTIFSIISSPQITTINQSCHQVGGILVEELLKKIEFGKEIRMTISMDTHLVIRGSTGPVPLK